MDFQVKMMPSLGDKEVGKAVIKMYDSDGIALDGQLLLEAETADTRLHMPPGGRMEVTEYDRNETYDTSQFAAVPVGTAEREGNIASPNTPRDEAKLRQYEDKVNRQILDEQQKNRKDGEQQEGVDARELRMKEAEEQEKRIAEYRKIPLPGESPEATKLRIEQGEKADKEKKEREKFLDELDPKDAEREKQKSEPHKGYSPSAPPPPHPAPQPQAHPSAGQAAKPGTPVETKGPHDTKADMSHTVSSQKDDPTKRR
jgi:hypothetical protein